MITMDEQCKKNGWNKDTAEGFRIKIEIEETCRMVHNKVAQPSTGRHHEEKKELAKY
jgi:hypothetical protein